MSSERPPSICSVGLPNIEQAHARHLQGLLVDLWLQIGRYRAAVSLCDYADTISLSNKRTPDLGFADDWQQIACRDCALTIYHIKQILDGILTSVHRCPTLLQLIDNQELKNAKRSFRNQFPNPAAARHTISHWGDFNKSPEEIRKHAFKLGPLFYFGRLRGRCIQIPYRGELVTVEVSVSIMAKLVEIEQSVYNSFLKAEPALNDLAEASRTSVGDP